MSLCAEIIVLGQSAARTRPTVICEQGRLSCEALQEGEARVAQVVVLRHTHPERLPPHHHTHTPTAQPPTRALWVARASARFFRMRGLGSSIQGTDTNMISSRKTWQSGSARGEGAAVLVSVLIRARLA